MSTTTPTAEIKLLAAQLRRLSQEEVFLLADLVGELRARQVAQPSTGPLSERRRAFA